MKAFLFPGQASQFIGMGKDLYTDSAEAKQLFEEANEILGYKLTEVMFNGTEEELKETKITQPAVFVHSVISNIVKSKDIKIEAVAGHSLGEFSALVANGVISFEDGLKLVLSRAMAMQSACDATEGTMAAIVGLEDQIVEQTCNNIDDIVVAANYNCPGQLVISGSVSGIDKAIVELKEKGAKMAIKIAVGGAFHSPLMSPAKTELEKSIMSLNFKEPKCPIYQNVTALPTVDPELIKTNLIKQLDAPVKWTITMENMIADGYNDFFEVGGNGKVLRGFMRRIDRKMSIQAL